MNVGCYRQSLGVKQIKVKSWNCTPSNHSNSSPQHHLDDHGRFVSNSPLYFLLFLSFACFQMFFCQILKKKKLETEELLKISFATSIWSFLFYSGSLPRSKLAPPSVSLLDDSILSNSTPLCSSTTKSSVGNTSMTSSRSNSGSEFSEHDDSITWLTDRWVLWCRK